MSDIDVEPVDEVDDEEGTDGEDEEVSAQDGDAGDAAARPHESTIDEGPTEIEVEVDEIPTPASEDPEYVLYGGKGGVGKTTMAAATALSSAASGTSTLVVSTDPAHSLSDTLETEIPPTPERVREDVPLYAAEIDPDAAVEESVAFAEDGGLGGLGELIGDEGPMDALMGGAMPGADEAAAMQTLLRYLDDDRFDRVVVDTAPTGHTLRLLELPEVMDTMVGRILQLRERLGGMMDGLKGMFGGAEEAGEVDPEEELDDLRVLRDRIERLRAVLRDPDRTDFRVVMVPEEMSVMESERLLARLSEFEIPVGTVVVNKVMEDLADVTDDVDAAAFVSPNLDTCEFCQARWDVQQRALARAQDVFRGHEVKRVPLFADEVRGERMLRIVAACLA
jgi:arsenite-transporting ATPase